MSIGKAMRNYRAFTLIEMVIVICLIAVITAMALPQVNYTAYRVDSGARAVRAAFQRAENYAVSSQHNQIVAIDVPNGEVYVVDDVNNNLAADPGEHITAVPLQDGVIFATPPTSTTWTGAALATSPLNAASLINVTINGNAIPAFVFRSDGAASTGLQLYLTSQRRQVTDWRGLSVTQATGRTDWYKDQAGTWVLGGL
jgi:prepilin-type N-terminal cleavage/methylation domain-containing protein